jgi:hypothetical protein
MSARGTQPQRPLTRAAAALLAAIALGVVVTAPPVAAATTAVTEAPRTAGTRTKPSGIPTAALLPGALATLPAAGDDGRRTFGVQPASAKKPDSRANFTYKDLKPGQHAVDHVAVVNVSDKPAKLTVYAADAFTTPSGAFDALPAAKKSSDVGAWVHLPRSAVTVPARSTLIMPFDLLVPANVEPGDHAGAIIASLKTLAKDSKGNTVTLDQRVGSRVYIRVAGALHPKLEIGGYQASYSGTANPIAGGRIEVRYTITNKGNVRLVGQQTLRIGYLFGLGGRTVTVPDMPELLPGSHYDVVVSDDGVPPGVLLTANATLDPRSVAGNVDPALEGTSANAWVAAIPWTILVILLALGGFFLWRWRSNRRKPKQATGWVDAPTRPELTTTGSTPMQRARLPRRPVRVVAALAAAVGSLALPASAAHAGAEGTLTFIPGNGLSISPMYAVTSGPCPQEASNVVGILTGKGFPPQGIAAVTNGKAPVSHTEAFGAPLQDTLAGFASSMGVTLSGPYVLELKCINPLGTQVYAQFKGTITFKDATHFTAPKPKKPVSNLSNGVLAQVFPEYASGNVPQNAPKPQSGAGAGGAKPAPQQAAPAATPDPAGTPVASGPIAAIRDTIADVPWVLAVLLVAVVIAAAVGPVRRRRAAEVPVAGSGPEWPDDDPSAGTRT